MSIAPLSKEAEQKLISALGEVADLVSGGSSPNDAIVKTAVDRQIPAGHLHLMTSAYNTGRTETQRKSSEDVLEKAGEFELADADVIRDRMFPETTKTAAEIRRHSVIDESYSRPPAFLAEREQREKVASLPGGELRFCAKPAPLPVESDAAAKRAFHEITKNHRAVETARAKAQYLFDRTHAETQKLASFLRQVGAPNFSTVRENAVILYGEPARSLFDHIAAKDKVLSKQAADTRLTAVDHRSTPYVLVQSILSLSNEYRQARADHEKIAADSARREVELKRPFYEEAEAQSVLGPLSETEKEAFFGAMVGTAAGSSMGRELGTHLGSRPIEVLKAKALEKVTDPQQEMALRNLQTESMLNDFMANDDVISTHDPNTVLGHFNELSQLAPRASSQSGLMRSLLRRRLQQGASDPYEVEQLIKIENGLRQRDGASQGVLDGSSVLG
jgi:hypothetical protein